MKLASWAGVASAKKASQSKAFILAGVAAAGMMAVTAPRSVRLLSFGNPLAAARIVSFGIIVSSAQVISMCILTTDQARLSTSRQLWTSMESSPILDVKMPLGGGLAF